MSKTDSTQLPFLDPDPHEWLTTDRLTSLRLQFKDCSTLLRQAGLWRAMLGYWVRWQVSLEAEWSSEEELNILENLTRQWQSRNNLAAANLTPSELRSKLRVGPAAIRWSRQQWGHRLENLYLQRKHELDKASCRLIRLNDKHFSFEIYHRIKAGETTFEQAARDYGMGSERIQGGLLPLQPLSQMPFGLAPLIERLQLGQLSKPLRLGDGFCLVCLERFDSAKLDVKVEETLLAEQLRLWIDQVVNILADILQYCNVDSLENDH